jgi:tetratricopeptide (TPR) repeat protein
VAVTPREVVGREEEIGAIVGSLDPERLPSAAVLTGAAGIGKTTLLAAGIDAASALGFRVLAARPAETETQLSFSGLSDLVGGFADEILPELPPIQRRALEGALLLGESEADAGDRTVAAAFLGAVRVLARDGTVCLAIDDLQWLDAASLAALRYVLARLENEPVAALLAARGALPESLRRAVPEGRLRTVDVGGLSVGATHELLRSRLDATFPRPTLLRIWETSRGNPFFALELATALQRRNGTLALGEELPIPSTLDELLHARLDGVSPDALEVTWVVAALADPTATVVEAVCGGARLDAGLAEALEARILELEGDRLRFTHPLLGSAVAARQTPARRRSLHARLADAVPSAEERTRHLALATAGPEPRVASLLEEAARTAHIRGAPAAAADLAEQALRLTPQASRDDARRRLLLAADMNRRAGDAARATELLTGALAAAAPGDERATVIAQLAHVEARPEASRRLSYEALDEAEGDALRAEIHVYLAHAACLGEGLEHGVKHADLAVAAASRVDDVTLRCRALAAYAEMHFRAGRGIPTERMEEALALERSLAERPLDAGPAQVLGYQLVWSADTDRAREVFHELRRTVKVQDDPALQAEALWSLGFLEWRAGNWEAAEPYAAEAVELRRQLGISMPPDEFPSAIIAAHRGRIDDARATAQRAIARAEAAKIGIAQSGHGWVLGFVELSLGDAAAALPYLRRSYDLRNDFMLEPAQRVELGDLLDALIASASSTRPRRFSRRGRSAAARVDRAWALAILARARVCGAARATLEQPSPFSSSSARRSGPIRRGPSSPGSAAGPPRATS